MQDDARISRYPEYIVFTKWKAISPLLKITPTAELEKLGINDPLELELCKIKSEAEFAKKYNLDPSTLWRWGKKKKTQAIVDKMMFDWFRKKTPSVLLGFYRSTVRYGDAQRVELWLKYFMKFVPTTQVDVNEKLIVWNDPKWK